MGIMVDELSESAVLSALTTQWLGRAYRYFASVGSTNDLLKTAVVAGNDYWPRAGTIYLTDYQSQGRGRLNRRWLAPAGTSLLLSILFRPGWPPEQAHWLTMLASLAAAEAVEAMLPLSVGVKWPNDLVVRLAGVWHKLAGVLVEGNVGQNGRLQSAVVGVGINVNIPCEHLPETAAPATSLLAAAGQSVSRLSLLVDFLQRLETEYERADNGQSPQPDWDRRLVTTGQQVRVAHAGQRREIVGTAVGTNEWGQLLVQDDKGRLHAVAAGDVTLR